VVIDRWRGENEGYGRVSGARFVGIFTPQKRRTVQTKVTGLYYTSATQPVVSHTA
jgi:hypothetical protein